MSELNTHFKPRRKWEGVTKYDEDMPAKAFELLSSGLSRVATAGGLGVSHKTLIEWCKLHPDFEAAVTEGLAAGQQLWEELAQTPKHEQYCPRANQFALTNIYRVNPPQPVQNVVIDGSNPDRAQQILEQLSTPIEK